MSETARAMFPHDRHWVGRIDGEHFIVEDDVDSGTSFKQLTGVRPPMDPVPLADIERAGGRVVRE